MIITNVQSVTTLAAAVRSGGKEGLALCSNNDNNVVHAMYFCIAYLMGGLAPMTRVLNYTQIGE